MAVDALQATLRALGSPEAAAHAARYFKTGPGQYGEGDQFVGVRVPALRKLAVQHRILPRRDIATLLHSAIHEERLLALLILCEQFLYANATVKSGIYEFYLGNTTYINNWDLVDASARTIVGGYLAERTREPLDRLAQSGVLWERRIGIVATHHFIVLGDHADTLRIAEQLLADREDLIHKAVGWMLREVGKRDQRVLEQFLGRHARRMPRTMLRYAIERFPEPLRKAYLLNRQASKNGRRTGGD